MNPFCFFFSSTWLALSSPRFSGSARATAVSTRRRAKIPFRPNPRGRLFPSKKRSKLPNLADVRVNTRVLEGEGRQGQEQGEGRESESGVHRWSWEYDVVAMRDWEFIGGWSVILGIGGWDLTRRACRLRLSGSYRESRATDVQRGRSCQGLGFLLFLSYFCFLLFSRVLLLTKNEQIRMKLKYLGGVFHLNHVPSLD